MKIALRTLFVFNLVVTAGLVADGQELPGAAEGGPGRVLLWLLPLRLLGGGALHSSPGRDAPSLGVAPLPPVRAPLPVPPPPVPAPAVVLAAVAEVPRHQLLDAAVVVAVALHQVPRRGEPHQVAVGHLHAARERGEHHPRRPHDVVR